MFRGIAQLLGCSSGRQLLPLLPAYKLLGHLAVPMKTCQTSWTIGLIQQCFSNILSLWHKIHWDPIIFKSVTQKHNPQVLFLKEIKIVNLFLTQLTT